MRYGMSFLVKVLNSFDVKCVLEMEDGVCGTTRKPSPGF